MKILIVDDSSTMRRIIAKALDKIGYRDIVEADNGKAAMEKLSEGGVDFVITDWNMPVMDGLHFVKSVRASQWNHLPILMVTTNAAKADVVEAVKAGINNYVIKPFTPDTLETKIQLMLAKA